MAKPKPPWSAYQNYDIGELNPLDEKIFDDNYFERQDVYVTQAELVHKHYSHGTITKSGPYLAVVLKVLSGPQVNNEAATNGGNLTRTISLNNFKGAQTEEKEKGNRPQPVKVIARIPEIDADIDWPEDEDDEARLAAHSEFHQMREDKMLEQVVPGSLIWIDYNSIENTTGCNGMPAGKIVSLHDPGSFTPLESDESSADSFNPPCKALRDLTAPGGGIYIGQTESDPVLFMGPPIRKFKGRIKTGLFGNGTVQTKEHFNSCLISSKPSAKHKIPGAAPYSDSGAFVWVGHLRSNGYMDIFDRPAGLGRETIIYAPGMLDLTSPIEIKYYLHDFSGFGRAWVYGEETDMEVAQNAADDTEDNDFRDKIGPGIKDLIRDGRNFILVIPEMSYSLGFESEDYSRLFGRELSTFDGTSTGGNFGNFHGEVLEVLERHFPGIEEKNIDYVSILADGMGAIAFAAAVKNVTTDSYSVKARQDLLDIIPIKRIDFIDTGLDAPEAYAYFGGFKPPSKIIHEDYLAFKDQEIEFNYITEHPGDTTNSFFAQLGQHDLFKKHNKPVGGLGGRKFSFNFENPASSFVSMHIAAKDTANVKGKVGYAFSMTNDYGKLLALKKIDSDGSLLVSYDSVPDHAGACSKSQAAADSAKIQKKLNSLREQIKFFEGFLIKLIESGLNYACDEGEPEYRIYCTTINIPGGKPLEAVETNNSSRFFIDYLNYLTNKRDLAELEIISNFENQLLSHSLYKPRLEKFKEDVLKPKMEEAKEVIKVISEPWEKLHKSYDATKFNNAAFITSDITTPNSLSQMASFMAAPDAYEKIMLKVDNTIEKISSQAVQLSPECAPPPIKLGAMVSPKPINAPETLNSTNVSLCDDRKVSVPNNFEEIYAMIPYAPDKKRFKLSGRSSKVPTQLDMIESYELGTFSYRSRVANGQTTNAESPPIWSCITDRISNAWSAACAASNYVPFSVIRGIRGYDKYEGNTAYRYGMSLHAFGLAIDIDPYIASYSKNGQPVYSVYTGAWSASFLSKYGKELYDLGVFKNSWRTLIKNAYQGENELRMAENWDTAPSSYKGAGESGGQRGQYMKVMQAAKGSPIVAPSANPTLWLITFCETSGMRWGNAKFLKKRWRGGKRWTESEQKRISQIYNIPNIVKRIKGLSWKSYSIEDHMHFHFWTGKSLIPWAQIVRLKKRIG